MSGWNIPTTGEPPTSWSFNSALELTWCLWVCHLPCRLRIKVYLNCTCLVLILDPFDFNLFILCLWAMSLFQKLCSAPFLPVSFSFPEPLPGPQFCLYKLLEGQPENSWTLGGKYYIISNPSRYWGLHLPCFLQHVQQQHLSVNLPGQATSSQCLLVWHPFQSHQLTSLQRQLGFQG